LNEPGNRTKVFGFAVVWICLVIFTVISYSFSLKSEAVTGSLISILLLSAMFKFLLITFGFMELLWAHVLWKVIAFAYAVLLFSVMVFIMA